MASGTVGFDSAFLQEVMQLHSVLDVNLEGKFARFQADVLREVGQMKSSQAPGPLLKRRKAKEERLRSPFSLIVSEKMKEIA